MTDYCEMFYTIYRSAQWIESKGGKFAIDENEPKRYEFPNDFFNSIEGQEYVRKVKEKIKNGQSLTKREWVWNKYFDWFIYAREKETKQTEIRFDV